MKKITAITLLPVLVMLFAFIAKPVQTPEQLVAYDYHVESQDIASDLTVPVVPSEASVPSEEITTSDLETTSDIAYTQPVTADQPISGSKSEEMLGYALTLLGTPYLYGGTTKDGFDCSGFTSHVFETYGVTIGRSSGMQALDGVAVERHEVRQGDLLIFTGTTISLREPGHVGIVISAPGDDVIEFIHSSSVGGVKISQVEGSRYDDRLLQIRRVL